MFSRCLILTLVWHVFVIHSMISDVSGKSFIRNKRSHNDTDTDQNAMEEASKLRNFTKELLTELIDVVVDEENITNILKTFEDNLDDVEKKKNVKLGVVDGSKAKIEETIVNGSLGKYSAVLGLKKIKILGGKHDEIVKEVTKEEQRQEQEAKTGEEGVVLDT